MLAIDSEGSRLGFSRRMTSHQNEKDRWPRHYRSSQNFSSFALFRTKHPRLRSDVSSFSASWFLDAVMNSLLHTQTNQFLHSYSVFWQAVYRASEPLVCTTSQFQVHKDGGLKRSGVRGGPFSGMMGKPSLLPGVCQFVCFEVFDHDGGKSSFALTCGLKCSRWWHKDGVSDGNCSH